MVGGEEGTTCDLGSSTVPVGGRMTGPRADRTKKGKGNG